MKCVNCGNEIEDKYIWCPVCGTKKPKIENLIQEELQEVDNTPVSNNENKNEKIICLNCNSEINSDSKFCTHCGNKIVVEESKTKNKISNVLSILSLIFLFIPFSIGKIEKVLRTTFTFDRGFINLFCFLTALALAIISRVIAKRNKVVKASSTVVFGILSYLLFSFLALVLVVFLFIAFCGESCRTTCRGLE